MITVGVFYTGRPQGVYKGQAIQLGNILSSELPYITLFQALINDTWLLYDPQDPIGSTLTLSDTIPFFTQFVIYVTQQVKLRDCVPWSPTEPVGWVEEVVWPDTVPRGSKFTVKVRVANYGGAGGLFEVSFSFKWLDRLVAEGLPAIGISMGSAVEQSFVFEEAWDAGSIDLAISVTHKKGTGWVFDSHALYMSVVGEDPEWKLLHKPTSWREILEGGVLNINAGEWAVIGPLKIPPWSFTPGQWIEDAIDWVVDGVNWLVNKAREIWIRAEDAFQAAWGAMSKIDDWIASAASWLGEHLDALWDQIYPLVRAVVDPLIDGVQGFADAIYSDVLQLDTVFGEWRTEYDDFKANLGEWVKNVPPFDWLLDSFGKVWEFWQEAGEQLVLFFQDPPGWIIEKIDDWLNEEV